MSASCDACGWAAAVCSMLAFGSFGVPIKSGAAVEVDIDPLVMQSYKTFMTFATSWLVLAAGEPFHFTPWGIVSGLFWVPGGIATVYAIKTAGIAIGIGIGSSFIVLVSFWWGIFVFDEQIHSRFAACFAIGLMILGLFGMSYYSSPVDGVAMEASAVVAVATEEEDVGVGSGDRVGGRFLRGGGTTATTNRGNGDGLILPPTAGSTSAAVYREIIDSRSDDDDGGGGGGGGGGGDDAEEQQHGKVRPALALTDRTAQTTYSDSVAGSTTSSVRVGVATDDDVDDDSISAPVSLQSHHVVMCGGIVLTPRRLGMLSAAFCGVWGGSIMAPMKYSPPDTKGVGYLMSFSIGASLVTLTIWLLRFLYNWRKYESAWVAYQSLPSFHFRKMWCQGATCGLLWSVGNFFSLFSVYYLGEGVGYPLVQTSILVSGLWGIFYFREVQGWGRISKWLMSSGLTIAGIILLSYEHGEA